jgi:hypothetical protein
MGQQRTLHANKRGEVEGYSGLYNFRHPFWAAQGSRLYGPTPHVSLNHAQNLAHDIIEATSRRVDYELLVRLLEKPAFVRAISVRRWCDFRGWRGGRLLFKPHADHVAIVHEGQLVGDKVEGSANCRDV